jgi:SAM-dependent methyltransferase
MAPPRVGVESRLRRYISRLGLLPLAFVVWRTLREWSPDLVRHNRDARKRNKDGVPIPPSSLLFSAAGSRSVEWFLNSSAQTAGAFREALTALGRPVESFKSVLDFGCGCGRVMRQWARVRGPRFTGCDYNEQAIGWDQQNLRFARFERNSLLPPLPFESDSFDLCYAVSVFTHLPSNLQRPWIEELRRVLSPNGILMLTLSGRGDFRRLTEADRESFDDGNLVVLDPKFAGTNMCGVYHPEAYVRREWSDIFELVSYYPEGAKGSPKQDLFVFRRL